MLTFTGWINRQQADSIAYLVEENRVLRELLGDKPLRLTDAQRRLLAVKGKALGRNLLSHLATIVTPTPSSAGITAWSLRSGHTTAPARAAPD